MIKKVFTGVLIIFVFCFSFCLSPVLADDTTSFSQSQSLLENAGQGAGYSTSNQGPGAEGLAKTVGRIIQVILSILGVIFICLIIYGGVKYMFAQGDPDKAKKAMGIIKDSIIGLAIVLASYAISYFVVNALIRATNPNIYL